MPAVLRLGHLEEFNAILRRLENGEHIRHCETARVAKSYLATYSK
jgi:hypothetical protein